jgi:hypothetical protein
VGVKSAIKPLFYYEVFLIQLVLVICVRLLASIVFLMGVSIYDKCVALLGLNVMSFIYVISLGRP